jgi:hypothetical protein
MSERAKKPASPTPKRTRSPVKDPGGTPEARRMAAAILEVWAGVRTPQGAASALGVSPPRFYQLEQRAVATIVAACEPRPRGPGVSHERQLRALERQLAVSRRDCARLQALVRTSQRTIGLPTAEPPAKAPGGKRRSRRPTARALRLAKALSSSGASPGEGVEPEAADGAAERGSTVNLEPRTPNRVGDAS